jgi:hypothetical protein
MPGPVPGIHVLGPRTQTWMAGTSPAMTGAETSLAGEAFSALRKHR